MKARLTSQDLRAGLHRCMSISARLGDPRWTSSVLTGLTVWAMLVSVVLVSCTPAATPTPTAVPSLTLAPAVDTPTPTTALLPVATTAPTATSLPISTATPMFTPTPTTAAAPTNTSTATHTPAPAATATSALPLTPDPAIGKELWAQLPCQGCHGQQAEGAFGPRLSGLGLSFEQVLAQVRLGKGQMPAFDDGTVSDLALQYVYAWLRSLAPPTPTPPSKPSFPAQALTEMWYFVNEMRIRADFAKDLPVRVASDDAGRLNVLKDYAGDGLVQAQQVQARANQALNEVPIEGVRSILREIQRETDAVTALLNQALAQDSYAKAWPYVASAVATCRIDTLPWATQAIRDAGLVGTVRIRVLDQAGKPLAGALATALSAHTPLGARTDSSGGVTFVNVAAVPALAVKAYAAGRVYHEFNVNLAPGATTEANIVLPPLPGQAVAPRVSDAVIEPAAGPGDAVVTLRMNVTDPQGNLDLAEDQIFALSPDLGLAYVLLHAAGDTYEAKVTLPNLLTGLYAWHFFAVDHECNTSSIVLLNYTVN
jgi:mono/diheme cytochrome c family protein